MNMISKEDYLRLLQEVANAESNDLDDQDIPEDAWIPAESGIKEKMAASTYMGSADITKLKRAEIGAALLKYHHVKVGGFTIQIDKCRNGNNATTHLNLDIWEKQYKTPTGNPCNMDYRVDFDRDNRFTTCSWLPLFTTNKSGSGTNILIATAVDIIRWLQAIQRISAFM
jgi:hypothetical protein